MTSPPRSKEASARVAIIGAGKVGSALARQIVEKNLADVVLLDVVAGLAKGTALDLSQSRGLESHDRQILGTSDYDDLGEPEIVAIAAGFPRQPGMTRDELLQANAKIVIEAAREASSRAPDALLLVLTNPLDAMTRVAWQATDLPPRRAIGMAGALDSARLRTFIALELGVSAADVSAMVIGEHGPGMVPLPRYCAVNGVPITELMDETTIDKLVERTRRGGTEIVELLEKGGAYFTPAAAACLMIESILRDRSRLIPAATYLQGEYGLTGVFLGVPCWLGREGVKSVLELSLSEAELAALRASAEATRRQVEQLASWDGMG